MNMAGPGVLLGIEAKPWAERPRRAIADKYGLDLLENGLIEESYSPAENIVTTIRGTSS